MKTAEDFRRSIGCADDAFAQGVRRTLDEMMREEDKPVKKKMSLGLALALIITLVTVTALAASRWGILDFARQHGEEADPTRLVTVTDQDVYKLQTIDKQAVRGVGQAVEWVRGGSELVEVELEELLYDDGWLYAAMLVKPLEEGCMVIGDEMQSEPDITDACYLSPRFGLQDITQPGSMARYADAAGVDPALSVREYADSLGFDKVVRLSLCMLIRHADYELLPDGSMRMLVQMEYNHTPRGEFPDQIMHAFIPLMVTEYGADGLLAAPEEAESLELEIRSVIRRDSRSRVSIPEDAHQIEGYRGFVEQVIVTPMEDGRVSVVLQLDQQSRHFGVMQMSGPVVVILDADGRELHREELYRSIDKMQHFVDGRVMHNIVMPGDETAMDSITIRLVSWRNETIVYDEHTYTLR